MKELFDQVKVAADHGLYYLALFASLTIPDICAGLEAPDGLTTGVQYAAWFDKWVGPKYIVGGGFVGFSGDDCWLLRCSMLHLGTTQKPQARYRRYVFTPGRGGHANVFERVEVSGFEPTSFVQFSIEQFCYDVVDGATAWLATAQSTATFQKNYDRFMRLYRAGFPPGKGPYLFGGFVIT